MKDNSFTLLLFSGILIILPIHLSYTIVNLERFILWEDYLSVGNLWIIYILGIILLIVGIVSILSKFEIENK